MSPSLSESVRLFLTESALRNAPATVQTRKPFCKRFLTVAALHHVFGWSQVNAEFLNRYLQEREAHFQVPSPARTTLADDSKNLRVFLRYGYKQGWSLQDLCELVEPIRPFRRLPIVLTEEEVDQWMALCDLKRPIGLRDRAIFELAYGTGLRLGELLRLTLSHLDLEQSLVRVDKTKNTYERCVPLPQFTRDFLLRYLAVRERDFPVRSQSKNALWLSYNTGYRMSKPNLLDRFAYYRRQWKNSKRVTIHTFRHSYATHLVRSGARVRQIQELLGHRCVGSTQLYLKADISDLHQVLKDVKWRQHDGSGDFFFADER